jgi:lipase
VILSGHDIHVVTDGEGPPTLLIHCSLASHRTLLPLAARLPGRKTLFDQPGHGQSADWDGTGDYQTLCSAIAATLCDGPTHVIGHSFGATVALRLACDRPDLVGRLTLIEPVFFAAARGTGAWTDHQRAFAPFVHAIQAGDLARAAAVFHGLWGDGAWADLPGPVQQSLIRRIPLIPAQGPAIEDDNAGLMTSGVLTRLPMAVTLIRGARSPAVIPAIHRSLMALIRHARDHVIPDADHMVPVTHPDQVAGIIA